MKDILTSTKDLTNIVIESMIPAIMDVAERIHKIDKEDREDRKKSNDAAHE